jgi:hypothetical protein
MATPSRKRKLLTLEERESYSSKRKILNPRSSNHSELNEQIYQWYTTARVKNMPVSGVFTSFPKYMILKNMIIFCPTVSIVANNQLLILTLILMLKVVSVGPVSSVLETHFKPYKPLSAHFQFILYIFSSL